MRARKKTALLSLKNVSVRRGESFAVRGMNWVIRSGENWAVVGANGSGKSSLAAAIAGEAATVGDIEYGFAVEGSDPCERIASVSFSLHRSFLAQADGYYQSRWYPGEEEATLTARAILASRADPGSSGQTMLTRIADLMGIGRLLNRQALHLSMGEMRRLLIARALLISPDILLLDEPFIGLDVKGRAELSKILEKLMRSGQHIIFFTARPEELPASISHILWLWERKVLGATPRSSSAAKKMSDAAFRVSARQLIRPIRRMQISARPVIELRNVNLNAGGLHILRDVNWTVRAGERWAVSGPNGAGKTTLLSLLTGDHPQSFAQEIRLFGHSRGDGGTIWEWKSKIGWAAPDIALHYDALTSTFDFICTGFFETLGLYQKCSPAQRRVAKGWLKYFDLVRVADKPFRTLSDGQQRLALLARAIVKSPPLLILDEPCQGLDKNSRDRVLSAIESLCRNNATTLVMVTHYASELPPSITHRMELQRGKRPKLVPVL